MKSKQPPKLIIFGLIGTLADAGERYATAFGEVCLHFGFKQPNHNDILKKLGNANLNQIIDSFVPDLKEIERDSFFQKCNEVCDAMLYRPNWKENLFPNVQQSLQYLNDNGDFKFGIFSGIRNDAIDNLLDYHDISQFFDKRFIRGKDNYQDKEEKSSFLKAKQLKSIITSYQAYVATHFDHDTQDTNIPLKNNVLVIGDSSADLHAANLANLTFIHFSKTKKDIKHPNFHSYDELSKAIFSIKNQQNSTTLKNNHKPL